jgi:hypothetical protein
MAVIAAPQTPAMARPKTQAAKLRQWRCFRAIELERASA